MMTVSHLFEDLVSGIIQENALLSERIIWMGKATSLSPQLIQVFGKVLTTKSRKFCDFGLSF